jgi:hypothetical protein
MAAAQPTSLREIRAELRKIPRDRRRDIVNAIRAGRAVHDSRDAALAVAWADYLDRRRFTWAWPRWVMPRERPRGKHAWLWGLHAAWMLVAVGIAVWSARLPSPWDYLVIAFFAYSAVTVPFTLRRTLRSYWNAPQAAAANRELIERGTVSR